MIHVLIDSCIYRRDPQRKSAAFQVLTRLGNKNELLVHIPYFVKHEFLSQMQKDYSKLINNVGADLKKLSRIHFSTDLKKAFKEQLSTLNSLGYEVKKWVTDDFELWCRNVGAEQHSIMSDHGSKMAERYFAGEPPFREPKKRDDIPDAFIFLSICDIAEKIDELHVITSDKKLREACDAIDNVITYGSLDSFIKSDLCEKILKDAKVVQHFKELIGKIKHDIEKINSIASTKLNNELSGFIFSDLSIPDDNNEAMISMLDVPQDIGLNADKAEYYGSGILVLPFEFEMEVLATYHIFKSDYHCLSEDRAVHISVSEYDNKHYYEAEEEFLLSVIGHVALTLDFSSVPHNEPILDYLDVITEKVEVEVSDILEINVNNP